MPCYSRPKDRVLSHAYVPGIHALVALKEDVDGRDKPGHDAETHCLSFVMPALVAGIHVFLAEFSKARCGWHRKSGWPDFRIKMCQARL